MSMDSDSDFLNQMNSQMEAQRLKGLYDDAAARGNNAAERFNSAQADAASERVDFYEKLAIGAGAAIAAIVSFVGSKAHSLQPPWLLRASLVSLTITMAAALVRNYLYTSYLLFARQIQWLVAYREKEKRATELMNVQQLNIDVETGNPIDAEQFAVKWKKSDLESEVGIEHLRKRIRRYFHGWKHSGELCFLSLVAAAIGLIILVWWNF